MIGEEISLWMDQRELRALCAALKISSGKELNDTAEKQMRALYEAVVPEEERQRIAAEIEEEEQAQAREREENRVRSALLLRVDGESTIFETDKAFDDLSMAFLIRRYVRHELEGEFAAALGVRSELTREELKALIALRDRNGTLVSGIFLVDLDAGIYGTYQVLEGWKGYTLRAVSAAIYYVAHAATRNVYRQLDIYWTHLNGKTLQNTTKYFQI